MASAFVSIQVTFVEAFSMAKERYNACPVNITAGNGNMARSMER
jgi:hypothetical protein